ncbi:MAG: ATP-binding cassette domain-containing protein [Cellulosilyticaceae bacterium]
MEYTLVAKKLNKKYKQFHAINDLSIQVPKGSIYGLVGKNGAGKTTLIRMICGLQKPTDGEFFLYGVSNKSKKIIAARRKMGAIVESPAIYLDITAEENIKRQFFMLGMPTDNKINELLKLVGLENIKKKKAKDFSLGMRQRLGIAMALAGNPNFLILDEPVNGLDPQGIIEMRELILKLNQQYNITVLISSHMLDELSRLATHYGFVDKGRMVEEISAKELELVCKKSMYIEVSDIDKLVSTLESKGINYEVISENSAKIFDKISITEIVLALAEKNCEVNNIREHEETLESYFIKLIGGKTNV